MSSLGEIVKEATDSVFTTIPHETEESPSPAAPQFSYETRSDSLRTALRVTVAYSSAKPDLVRLVFEMRIGRLDFSEQPEQIMENSTAHNCLNQLRALDNTTFTLQRVESPQFGGYHFEMEYQITRNYSPKKTEEPIHNA